MMNKNTLRRQKQALRKRNAKQMFLEPLPPSTASSAQVPASTPVTPSLSPENQRLLTELGDLVAAINKLFHRASLKLMIEGMTEARIDSVK
jgi:hypothetical protein